VACAAGPRRGQLVYRHEDMMPDRCLQCLRSICGDGVPRPHDIMRPTTSAAVLGIATILAALSYVNVLRAATMTCIEAMDPAPTALGGQHDTQMPAKKPSLTQTSAKAAATCGEPADDRTAAERCVQSSP
jgi:hypothetical protein